MELWRERWRSEANRVCRGDGKARFSHIEENQSSLFRFENADCASSLAMAPCQDSGLAGRTGSQPLFAAATQVDDVFNAEMEGRSDCAIGGGLTRNAFDLRDLAFASTGDGKCDGRSLGTQRKNYCDPNVRRRNPRGTMGLDTKSHKIFLPAADFDPPAPGERRGKMKRSFVLM